MCVAALLTPEALGENRFLTHWICQRNSVPRSCTTEVPCSLLGAWWPLPAFSKPVVEGQVLSANLSLLLPSSAFKENVIRLGPPGNPGPSPHPHPHPISTRAKSPLQCKIPYSQVLGIWTWTSLGNHHSAHHQVFEQWSCSAENSWGRGRGREGQSRNKETGKDKDADAVVIQRRNDGGFDNGTAGVMGQLG